MRARDASLHSEPPLHDLLDDPVIQAVMRRDRVDRTDVLDLVLSMRERLAGTEPAAAAVAA